MNTTILNNGDTCPTCNQGHLNRRAAGLVCSNCRAIFPVQNLPPLEERRLIERVNKDKKDAAWAERVLFKSFRA
jgi:heterodisulfide reductase subunit C